MKKDMNIAEAGKVLALFLQNSIENKYDISNQLTKEETMLNQEISSYKKDAKKIESKLEAINLEKDKIDSINELFALSNETIDVPKYLAKDETELNNNLKKINENLKATKDKYKILLNNPAFKQEKQVAYALSVAKKITQEKTLDNNNIQAAKNILNDTTIIEINCLIEIWAIISNVKPEDFPIAFQMLDSFNANFIQAVNNISNEIKKAFYQLEEHEAYLHILNYDSIEEFIKSHEFELLKSHHENENVEKIINELFKKKEENNKAAINNSKVVSENKAVIKNTNTTEEKKSANDKATNLTANQNKAEKKYTEKDVANKKAIKIKKPKIGKVLFAIIIIIIITLSIPEIRDSKTRIISAFKLKMIESSNSDKITNDEKEELLLNSLAGKTWEKAEKVSTSVSEFEYDIYDNSYISILRYNGNDKNIIVPSIIKGYPVIKIADGAFSNNIYIEEVILPKSLMYIGDGAFSHCYQLHKIEVGDNLISIGNYAFSDDNSLTEIIFSNTIWKIKYIGQAAFANCSSLSNINISSDYFESQTINSEAFNQCQNLKEIVLSNNCKSISYAAFNNCASLTNINLSNVEEIGESAFANCESLKEINLNEAKNIDDYAFTNTALSNISIPKKTKYIGEYAFANIPSLAEVTIEENTSIYEDDEAAIIDQYAFSNTGINSIIVPAQYDSVGYCAFQNCNNLITFTLNDSQKNYKSQHIDSAAFMACDSLQDIYLPVTIESFEGFETENMNYTIHSSNQDVIDWCQQNKIAIEE